MLNRHLRSAVVATAAITAGLLMTACQNGTDDSASGITGTGVAGVTEKETGSTNSKGVSASFKNGEVTYRAPGKYIVSVPGKGDQQFLVADDTEVYGAGTICGTAGAGVDAPCTLDQLEAATKEDAVSADVEMRNDAVSADVEMRNGIATLGPSGEPPSRTPVPGRVPGPQVGVRTPARRPAPATPSSRAWTRARASTEPGSATSPIWRRASTPSPT
ncbi:hypothetical protein [Streptomyces phaeoluteigriseus]|uniref:hypothetical protein n=1 Tax=Streptomyces phaeoluteigriseus TaxID=114686 RepID=UPI001FEB358F|nr:hypothetical protein [Streptomyces phaeoluteigriseus]